MPDPIRSQPSPKRDPGDPHDILIRKKASARAATTVQRRKRTRVESEQARLDCARAAHRYESRADLAFEACYNLRAYCLYFHAAVEFENAGMPSDAARCRSLSHEAG